MRFVWVDLETSGLNSKACSICEIAAIVTDEDLKEVSVFNRVVDSREAYWEAYPMQMHLDNGLIDDMGKEGVSDWETVGDEFLCWLKHHMVTSDNGMPERFYLAGSSVHFDRKFIDDLWKHDIEKYFSHRMLDVSAVKIAIMAVHGKEIAYEYEDTFKGYSKSDHRALSDIRNSINMFRHFKENDFKR